MADLAFDETETIRLGEKYGLALDETANQRLLDETGGWAAAIVTAMQQLRATNDVDATDLHINDEQTTTAKLLEHEVLDSLSTKEATVLTKTAIRHHVPRALAVALTENPTACEILDQISQRISFVTSRRGYYYFHPVLLNYLQSNAELHDTNTLLRAHAIAAQWHYQRGEAEQALAEAALSQQPKVITSAVDRFGLELILRGNSSPVLQAVERLPSETPHLMVIVTHLLLELPDFVDTMQVSHLFDQALTEARPIRLTNNKWLAAVLALQCFQKDSRVPLNDRLTRLRGFNITILRRRELALDALISTAEAWGMSQLGETQKAQKMLRDVRITTKRAGYTWLYLLATQLAIDIANQTGDWHIAAACEEELDAVTSRYTQRVGDRVNAIAAIMIAKRSFRLGEPLPADSLERIIADDADGPMFGLDVLAAALLNFPELDSVDNPRPALETLDRLAGAHAMYSPQLFSIVALRMVDVALRLDGRQRATEMAERFAVALGPECVESKTIRFLLRRSNRAGDPAESELIAAIDPKGSSWHTNSSMTAWHAGASVAAWLLLARAAESQGRHDEATARLLNSLRDAHRVQVIQPFAAFEAAGAKMLASRAGRLGPLEDFAVQIRQRVTELYPVSASQGAPKDLLTAREHEILHELPLYQSVSEIAYQKTLSVNTVKSHLRNIYQKLDATGRSEAVAKARHYGLL
ncbi:helix-turn-helix transcriptional regulator [Enteractinococcus helveticum]|uniref:HTH luxR-type domain-containing protein n=1 Tax=Enteractinococcus helveticum TaxID=1837282 RepID=A0A1B7M101_9MICC|nr:LuxR C-terminal-related transcriptional regulator [Enteractinococcus helveticum]OAV62110.1 hypothetical protein A6F49_07380 [Enteractinococcus helveticum]